jgi:hypothetical protein
MYQTWPISRLPNKQSDCIRPRHDHYVLIKARLRANTDIGVKLEPALPD